MQKILIIDDDAMLREVTAQVLETHGFTVIQAHDGESGLELAQKHSPRLIICDVSMPKFDGFWTLAELRKNPLTASIPFIFLTGQEDRAHMRQGMDLGADDYITKPVTSKELLAAVESRLQKHDVMIQEAEKKLEELRLSVSLSIPHEMRTPLFGILGFSEILRTDPESLSAADIQEMGENIHRSATRLHHVLENFLVYAQLELMASDPEKQRMLTSVQTTATYALIEHLATELAQRHDRSSDLTVEGTDCPVALSSDYLAKICTETIDNAFKFSKKGSPVRVSMDKQGEYCRIVIRDSGTGMSRDQIGNIGGYMQFERRIREQQGTGLGLAIARRLSQLHGGGLTIESEPNQHTRVIIDLPVARRST